MQEISEKYNEIYKTIISLIPKKYIDIRVYISMTDRVRKISIWSREKNSTFSTLLDLINNNEISDIDRNNSLRIISDNVYKIREFYRDNNMCAWNMLTIIISECKLIDIVHNEIDLDVLNRDYNVKDYYFLWKYIYVNGISEELDVYEKRLVEMYDANKLNIVNNEFTLENYLNGSVRGESFNKDIYLNAKDVPITYIDEVIKGFKLNSKKYLNVIMQYSHGNIEKNNCKFKNDILVEGKIDLILDPRYKKVLKYILKNTLDKDNSVFLIWGTGTIIFELGEAFAIKIGCIGDVTKVTIPYSNKTYVVNTEEENIFSDGEIAFNIKWSEIPNRYENLEVLRKRMINKGLDAKQVEEIFSSI